MIKIFRYLLVVSFLLIISVSSAFAQADIDIPLIVSSNAPIPIQDTVWVGLDQAATDGIDAALGESNLPGLPPSGTYDIRLDIGGGKTTFRDYRAASSYPFTGSYTHLFRWQQKTGGTNITFSYTIPSNATMTIQDNLTGTIVNSGPLLGTGTFVVSNPALSSVNIIMNYTGIAPAGPTFTAAPVSPLTIIPTALGSSNTGTVTVSNTGTLALDITGITSSNTEFSIAPTTANIAVGSNQVFTVTFTPASLGNKTTNLSFTHNGAGSPTTYVVNGVGASAGPTFSSSTSTLDFGTINQGNTTTRTVTVTNNGLTNPLTIAVVSSDVPQYTVSPAAATIPAGGNQVFTVTFAPTTGGSFPGILSFNHNDPNPGTIFTVTLSGSAASVFGLIFKEEYQYRKEDSTYTDTLQLKSPSAKVQALQFRLLVNPRYANQDTILTFMNITKGSNVSSSNWALETNVMRGPFTANGASVDTIFVLLYNLTQNGGLDAGTDYNDLLRVKYLIADLPGLKDTVKSSFKITNASASTTQGAAISITGSRDILQIRALNRTSSIGDVNGDGSLDILDLLNVVDHIVGRDSLKNVGNNKELTRADIAPWAFGSKNPTPDGVVNVQDLALIQNIILYGRYPDGTTLNKSLVIAGNSESILNKTSSNSAKIDFYITEEGILINSNSDASLRGVQLEFAGLSGSTSNMIIESGLGGGYYVQENDYLRVLLYDPAGNNAIPAGEGKIAFLPFTISNPQAISVSKVILVTTETKKIDNNNIETKILYTNGPEIPVDYSLSQNYPNPFNPTTSVNFSIPQDGFVTIKIFDMLGQEITTLFSGNAQKGNYTLNWNGKDSHGNSISSGSYIYRMTSGDYTQSKKMLLLK